MRRTSASLSSLRRRRLALIDRASTAPPASGHRATVRVANPIACSRFATVAILATPLANRRESDGYATFASTTVVSARTRFVFNTRASTRLASSASFNPSTAAGRSAW